MLSMLAVLALAVAPEHLAMGVGAQKVLPTPERVTRLGVADEAIAEVQALGASQILITGKAPGATRLTYFDAAGRPHTVELLVRTYGFDGFCEVCQILGHAQPAIRVRTLGDRILLDGSIQTDEALDAVATVHTLYPNVSTRLVELAPDFVEAKVREINLSLLRAGFTEVRVSVAGGAVLLEGAVEDQADAQKVAAIVAPLEHVLETARRVRGSDTSSP